MNEFSSGPKPTGVGRSRLARMRACKWNNKILLNDWITNSTGNFLATLMAN